MAVAYRPARAEELVQAEGLVAASINDLTQSHGFGRMASLRPPQFQLFSLKDDPDGLWIAEEGGEIRGFAFSWVCDRLWFLAELFVAPGRQGAGGVGNELLQRTLAHAEKRGATEKALITFAFNTVSQGLYIRRGLFPRLPIYLFGAPREAWRLPKQAAKFDMVALDMNHLAAIEALDARALGLSRATHYRYLIAESGLKGFLFREGGAVVGYAYISPEGHVGPLAVSRPDAIEAVFTAALRRAAADGAAQLSALIPGSSESVLAAAGAHGLRIVLPLMLMSSRDFGDWTCYLPRNPGFM